MAEKWAQLILASNRQASAMLEKYYFIILIEPGGDPIYPEPPRLRKTINFLVWGALQTSWLKSEADLRQRNYCLMNRIRLKRPCSWMCNVDKILWKRGTSVFMIKQSKCFFLRAIPFSKNPNNCCVTQCIKREKNNCFAHAQHESCGRTQRQNEYTCFADLWFERESITNAPLQSPNSHLLPQYFFCWIRYVMEEVRRNLPWKRQPYLFWFGLIHAKRKQTIGMLKMPPFCRVRLLTGDELVHSFYRCVMRKVLSLLKIRKISTPQIFNNRIPSTSRIIWFDLQEKAGSKRFSNPLLSSDFARSNW